MHYSVYYQAKLQKEGCGFLVSVLRSFEHLVFDRTLNKEETLFEFFVPQDLEQYFLELMDYFKVQGIVLELHKLPNRLANPDEQV